MSTFDPDLFLADLHDDDRRLCFYPSCGQRALWAVMRLEAEVFVLSDYQARTRQARDRFWQGIVADFRRHSQPLQLVKATVWTRVFRCGEKWGFLFFQDNNEVLASATLAWDNAPVHFQAINRFTLYLSGLQSRFGITILGSADRGRFIGASGKLQASRTLRPALERV